MHKQRILIGPTACRFVLLLAAVILVNPCDSNAQPATVVEPAKAAGAEQAGENWVRIRFDANNKPLALEVAVVRYASAKYANMPAADVPVYVDLVGAIHVGDLSYYQELNRRFRSYDVLLYELVAPQGTVVERGRGTSNTNPLGALQNAMKTLLELEHQLEKVDYTPKNFVHADLSPAEFKQSMKDKNESFLELLLRIMGQGIAMQSEQLAKDESTDLEILFALFSDDRPRKLKTAMAKQFQSMESMISGISGPEGSTLITARNLRALEVLRRQQAAGQRKIGIFYGAGHLSDMHKRLVEEFNLQPVGTVWLEAWDLRP